MRTVVRRPQINPHGRPTERQQARTAIPASQELLLTATDAVPLRARLGYLLPTQVSAAGPADGQRAAIRSRRSVLQFHARAGCSNHDAAEQADEADEARGAE